MSNALTLKGQILSWRVAEPLLCSEREKHGRRGMQYSHKIFLSISQLASRAIYFLRRIAAIAKWIAERWT